jgi:hypothetical protein
MTGAVLDAGALIAFERNDRRMVAIVQQARLRGTVLRIPAGVVAQVWRDGRTQNRLAVLLRAACCVVEPLDDESARRAGQSLGATGLTDVVDASVVVSARRYGLRIVTSDPNDVRRLDPAVDVTVI